MEEVRQQLVHYTVPTGYLGKGDGPLEPELPAAPLP